jgi:hypothetical protein
MPGTLVRSYFADNHIFSELNFTNCTTKAVDFVEVWDTYFNACAWENCGSTTEAAFLMRNTMPQGQFGYGTDNTNQIHFHDCRWESFKNGAVCMDGAANGSPNLLNGIFFVSCKMESRYINGPPLQIKDNTTIIFLTQLYIAMMLPGAGFSSPVDAIEDRGTFIFMTDVYIQWGSTVIPNSLIHIWKGGPHMYSEISSYFSNQAPAGGTIIAEPESSQVTLSSITTNKPLNLVGDMTRTLSGGPTDGYRIFLNNTGSFRIVNILNDKDLIKVDNNANRPALHLLNGVDAVGFSDNYTTEQWRIVGQNGAARFAKQRFQIEGTKGYVGMNTAPFTQIAMLIKPAVEGDRGIAVVRPTSNATNRLMEFQDETYNIQGMAIDANGRILAVGTPPKVTPGDQVSYANPGLQVRDIAGNIAAAVRPSPTAPGVIANVTFSRPYVNPPLYISLSDNSPEAANLYVSARSVSGFTVSTRAALRGGMAINFDYAVIA